MHYYHYLIPVDIVNGPVDFVLLKEVFWDLNK